MSDLSKAVSILRKEGPRSVAQRAVRVLYRRLGASSLEKSILPEDIVDSTTLRLETPVISPARGRPLRIGWVLAPPSAGSGGHTTLFRMVEALEQNGHSCVLFLYDRYGGDIDAQTRVIRDWWPQLRASVRDATEGIDDVDAVIASSWETAHVVGSRATAPMRHLYFIQDFEPFFYPRGSLYSLAEDTYRFGFRNIALGHMVADLLRAEVGIDSDVTEFGCDVSVYRPLPTQRRNGIVVYARPEVPRRGFWLAELALHRFHQAHPDVPIHLYGEVVARLPFPAVQHGRLSPVELNRLYNSSIAGVAMSFTNISLVAEEMLAAGAIPVVNDSRHSRADLANDFVEWAAPTPDGVAQALSRIVRRPDRDAHSRAAAQSVRRMGWTKAQADVVRIVEDEVYDDGSSVNHHPSLEADRP